MYTHTSEGLGQSVVVRNGDERVKSSLGEPQPKPRICDDRGIPEKGAVQALTDKRVACTQHNAFGETDPFRVISGAVARALEMLDHTIGELVNARSRVCEGETPASPLLRDITLEWLGDRLGVCTDDIRVWTAGTFENRRSVANIRVEKGQARFNCSDGRDRNAARERCASCLSASYEPLPFACIAVRSVSRRAGTGSISIRCRRMARGRTRCQRSVSLA